MFTTQVRFSSNFIKHKAAGEDNHIGPPSKVHLSVSIPCKKD